VRFARQHRHWLEACLRQLGSEVRSWRLQYTFVSAEEIAELHARHLGDPTPTDILTFGYSAGTHIEAEIYVAPALVRSFAQLYGTTFSEELRRVLVHGILHLLGWNDSTEAEQSIMRQQEDLCLKEWRVSMQVSHETA
jgi:rRNA maturation RNase YbeY